MYMYLYESIKMHIYMHAYLNMSIQNSLGASCISIHIFQRESGKRSNWALFKSYVIILFWKENGVIV